MNRSPAHHNIILGSLPASEYEALLRELEWVSVPSGVHLDELPTAVEHAYFPTQGVVSVVHMNEAGKYVELGMVGAEGMYGVNAFLGGYPALSRPLVRVPCRAYRLPARRLKAKFMEGGVLQEVLLAYAGSLIRQISVIAVCNRHHSLEKQVCRWLLQNVDRVETGELRVTQETIALLLGVRRQGVSETFSRLQARGLISSARGIITVTDHAGLLAHACECYELLPKKNASAGRVNRRLPSWGRKDEQLESVG